MNVLQVNGYESPGRRFNGLAITPKLKELGINSRHLVWEKDTNNPDVLTFDRGFTRLANSVMASMERLISLQSILYLNASQMLKMPAFKEADLIHLHIIHSGYLRISDLKRISQLKPTVWTLHDPWAMTGHCIHPFDCNRWQNGCGNCPSLEIPFALRRDTTQFLFNHKHDIYNQSTFEVIVASKWMQNMVEKSPLFKKSKTHLIPFGLDLDFFSPATTPFARRHFAIPENSLVIFFRAAEGKFKGLPYIIEALEHIKSKQPVCLLTLEAQGVLNRFKGRFQVIELGWTDNEQLIRDAFLASDIFLMPSVVEAFGLMAIEAMACGKSVISFDGTALPEVTFAPNVGISVPMHDSYALYLAIQRLIDDPDEREQRGRKARAKAELHYSDNMHARNLANIYHSMARK